MARKAGNLREKFIIEYLIDLNATQAAIRAGYSPKTAKSQGQRLLTFADVKTRIDEARSEQLKRVQITADYVLTKIRDTVERCSQEEPVLDKEGNATGEYKFESFAVLKGCELLGKHLKLFTDKLEISDQSESAKQAFAHFRSQHPDLSEEECRELLSSGPNPIPVELMSDKVQ